MDTDKLLRRSLLAGACAVGALAGCAHPPAPREQLAVGRSSIEAAQTAGAAEMAPVELSRAREKYNLAIAAAQDKRMDTARRLAEQADVDAQVARSKANAERSRKAADEISASLRSLRQQLDKNDPTLMPTAPAAGMPSNMDGPKMSPTMPSPNRP